MYNLVPGVIGFFIGMFSILAVFSFSDNFYIPKNGMYPIIEITQKENESFCYFKIDTGSNARLDGYFTIEAPCTKFKLGDNLIAK